MGEQLGLPIADDIVATRGQLAPTPTFREFEPRYAFPEWTAEDVLSEGDLVALVHRSGRVKIIKFVGVTGPSAYVYWPIANEEIEIGLRSGKLKGKHCRDWRIERSALHAIRRYAQRLDEERRRVK